MRRSSATAEDKMNSALWGCFVFAAIVIAILGAGAFLILRSLL